MPEDRERIISAEATSAEEEQFNWSLRPQKLDEVIGQRELVERLRISLGAARQRGEHLEHVLFYGPPGLGKTTFAHVIANEIGSRLSQTSGPALVRPADLLGLLTNLQPRDVLFIDEIHRLPAAVEEFLYPAMEDFRIDFVVDKGPFAKTVPVPLQPFTLVGATTRAGLISKPMRERFGIFHHVDFYPVADLKEILRRSARLLDVAADDAALDEIAKRSRGTPRVANRLLRRVRDYAAVKARGKLSAAVAADALALEGVDAQGLDEHDRKYLRVIIEFYKGGPVGIEAIASTLNEDSDNIQDLVEPFLLKLGFLKRTRTGREATDLAYKHLGLKPGGGQRTLF
ncbi:MAG TPA: Holliday junction branch migration DNA helicase RuvB [Planctomycetota bacterium]|nr:Holliday junction branch migration DNA helicase RuvB [Planctomycetota bacterium]HRR82549.1 Holliday junction branch migration DNA helicase RuvB [Planctomycetota bacterium]HRT95240.1 Holliday junction branch migration DNA helicase RuvB [Planctomycetota bacterium]